ncbi:MAG TPA: type VI secretion system baseplate subunit TssF [Desulfobacterales bacterium]|nr:type VI secretion system baseplate subunit TssF [Desulfobacterales bacterium]
MFNRYFQQELNYLKLLGEQFAKEHPALAPMLSGPTADPDVERLLEGVAFLTAALRQKLDDEFPEIVHELIQLIWPHYLRPIPCSTIVVFSPKPALKRTIEIPAGIYLNSVEVEGTQCQFKTCYPIELHPLRILEASFEERVGRPPCIRLLLELNGITLVDWDPKAVRFYLADTYGAAANIYLLLQRHLHEIIVSPLDGGNPLVLLPNNLKPVGFGNDEQLIPYPTHSFPGYRIFQEYFIMPEKFLFLDLTGLQQWRDRGTGNKLEISFVFRDLPFPPPPVRPESFALNATPVINIFPHEADPIRLDHKQADYLVRPSGANTEHYQVYSVERVVGYLQGTAEERIYKPFEVFNPFPSETPLYHVKLRRTPVKGKTGEFSVFLSVAYPPGGDPPRLETLSIELLCTNGALPESLQLGDISLPTSSTPEFVSFKNTRPVTLNILPPLGSNLLWRLVSLLSLNYLSLASAENLRALLNLYVFTESRDKASVVANQKRIQAIESVEAVSKDRLVGGAVMRGQEIQLKMRHDHFASEGDMFLFGTVLDHFFGSYAAINTYTRLKILETVKGETYSWPARIGDRPMV